jgi:hypothetical protein
MTDDPLIPGAGNPPTEDELRAAYEAEFSRLRVEEVIVQTVVSLLNLGARKAGLVPGTEGERDLDQVVLAVEGARALMPLAEPALGPNAAPLRDALAQLQLAYTQLAGGAGGAGAQDQAPGAGDPGPAPGAAAPGSEPSAADEGGDGGPGPAQRSGRLWVPGQ